MTENHLIPYKFMLEDFVKLCPTFPYQHISHWQSATHCMLQPNDIFQFIRLVSESI